MTILETAADTRPGRSPNMVKRGLVP